jgi:glycosyltransferase involved in cell wall biosynthesis
MSNFLETPLRHLDKKLVRKLDLAIVNSVFTKKRLDPLYNANMAVSYPPVDTSFEARKPKINQKYVFSSSRVIPDKKYEWLIKACSLMKTKLPLFVSGQVDPNYQAHLEDFARKLNVKIKFLGRLSTDELVDCYCSASVFAFPTPKEDFGLVPAESLTCGTPVVAWGDGAGPTEQVVDGINGYLAKPYELQDFADKIELCIENNLKQRNRKKILDSAKKFSCQEIKKDFIRQVKALLNK